MEEEKGLKCPKCRSTNLQTGKKGFSAGKAAVGAVLVGGVGLLAGAAGSRKTKLTCMNCGNEFSLDQAKQFLEQENRKNDSPMTVTGKEILVILAIISFFFLLYVIFK